MNDDVAGKGGIAVSRPLRALLAWVAALLVTSWALAGVFMGGEDPLPSAVPWLVVLGGGVAEERIDVACELYAEGHGREGVVLTGGSSRRTVTERNELLSRCGVPGAQLHQWPTTTDSFEELSAVAALLSANAGTRAIVVSDSLHMPRLRYIRDRLALNDRVILRQSRLGGRSDPTYLLKVAVFWFREPVAYIYYRLRY